MSIVSQRDLVVLAADSNTQAVIGALLARHAALRIRPIQWDVYVHPDRDPGCLRRCHDFLRPQISNYDYALVVFDYEGCGSELGAKAIEVEVEERLAASGWNERAKAIVIDPELEIWVWSDSPQVDDALGWAGRLPDLRKWLADNGHSFKDTGKPTDPKRAMEAALHDIQKPRSSAIYGRLAQQVSFNRCADSAFLKLRAALSRWFSA